MSLLQFLDTNALLTVNLDELGKFMISSVSIQELENIKNNRNKTDDIKYKARQVVKWLDKHEDKYKCFVYDATIEEAIIRHQIEISPDAKIVATAYCMGKKDDVFLTNDLCCKIIARDVFGLLVDTCDTEKKIYKGYRVISGTSADINTAMENMDLSDWNVNEYLIIRNKDDHSEKEMRFDGTGFVSLKLPSSKYIKGKNSLQRCALDILNNNDITIAAILGGYGSGKTYLCMQMGLYSVREKGWQSKILGVREPRGEGHEVGYLPGELNSKTELFFAPLMQQLEGGEFELERLMQQGMLESNIPYYLKGTTYNDTIILVDEAEDLTAKQIRLIGTRIGQGSKIYLAGDYKQAVVNDTEDNALIKMCSAFKGDPKFACIYLGEDVRSTTSKMFAELFNE